MDVDKKLLSGLRGRLGSATAISSHCQMKLAHVQCQLLRRSLDVPATLLLYMTRQASWRQRLPDAAGRCAAGSCADLACYEAAILVGAGVWACRPRC